MQARLEASLGTVPGVGLAAVLYGAYHVGYGMGGKEMAFLGRPREVYAIAQSQNAVRVAAPTSAPDPNPTQPRSN